MVNRLIGALTNNSSNLALPFNRFKSVLDAKVQSFSEANLPASSQAVQDTCSQVNDVLGLLKAYIYNEKILNEKASIERILNREVSLTPKKNIHSTLFLAERARTHSVAPILIARTLTKDASLSDIFTEIEQKKEALKQEVLRIEKKKAELEQKALRIKAKEVAEQQLRDAMEKFIAHNVQYCIKDACAPASKVLPSASLSCL